jgi:small subunit ribosomal protein S2
MAEDMLVNKTEYLTAGVHIGMKTCTPYMKQFVYKIRDDGLAVFNLQKVDQRIRTAVEFLSRFRKVLVVSRKENSARAIQAFADAVDAKAIPGRFSPGTLTNPSYRGFYEPDVVFVVDPLVDDQAIGEALRRRLPILALCDTFNTSKDIDLCIPVNNNGRKSLALIFWLLTRELLKKQGKLKKDSEFTQKLKDFGSE